jgi:hypothetical protein
VSVSTDGGATTVIVEENVVEGEFRQPLEQMNGMTPLLSLVEDLDETPFSDPTLSANYMPTVTPATAVMSMVDDAPPAGEVVHFPGGVGPRVSDSDFDDAAAAETTGEQPVIVIDADEPLNPVESRPMSAPRTSVDRRRPSFFGLRKKKRSADDVDGAGWFSNAPRDFDWE